MEYLGSFSFMELADRLRALVYLQKRSLPLVR